jgi:hypothetical protein
MESQMAHASRILEVRSSARKNTTNLTSLEFKRVYKAGSDVTGDSDQSTSDNADIMFNKGKRGRGRTVRSSVRDTLRKPAQEKKRQKKAAVATTFFEWDEEQEKQIKDKQGQVRSAGANKRTLTAQPGYVRQDRHSKNR